MKKYTVCAIAASAILAAAGMAPATAYAATASYNIPGGKMIVIGGNGSAAGNADCNQLIQDILNGNCTNGNFPGIMVPDIPNIPEVGRPDIPNVGKPDIPDAEQPDIPDDSQPEKPDIPDVEQPEKPDTGNTGSGSVQDAFADQVVTLVNEERAKAGLSPLTVHSGAASAAQIRAGEIQTQFSHTRPNGSSFSTALTQAGVSYRGSGENIAYGQTSPEQVMQSWMNSSGHRANILNSNYTSIGVGHYKNAAGVDYWVQLFIY